MSMRKKQKVQKLLFRVNKKHDPTGRPADAAAKCSKNNSAAVATKELSTNSGKSGTVREIVQFAKANLPNWLGDSIAPLKLIEIAVLSFAQCQFHNVLLITLANPEKKNSKFSFKCYVDIGQPFNSDQKSDGQNFFNGITIRSTNHASCDSRDSFSSVKVRQGQLDKKALGVLFKNAYAKARDIARAEYNRVRAVINARQRAFELNSKFRALLDVLKVSSPPNVAVTACVPIISSTDKLQWLISSSSFTIKFDKLTDDDKIKLHVALVEAGYGDLLRPLPDKNTKYDEVMDEGLPLYASFEKYYPALVKERQEAVRKQFEK